MRILVLSLLLLLAPAAQGNDTFLKEDFNNLSRWREFTFPSINTHSTYDVITKDGETLLRMKSNGSASGIILTKTFNPYAYPALRFRVRVENIYVKGNAKKKEGDDYPLRVYVIFLKKEKDLSFLERIFTPRHSFSVKGYVPQNTLTYIWANREWDDKILTNPYTSRAKMIIIEKGSINLGKWMTFSVNIRKDYQEAFGTAPPDTATVALMNDSDNTGESSVSYVDFLEVSVE